MTLTMTRLRTAQWYLQFSSYGSTLAGKTIRFTAKKKYTDVDDDAIIQKTSSDGITVTDAVAGQAILTVDPTDTESLPASVVSLFFDIQLVNGDEVDQAVAGNLVVYPNVATTITA